MTFTVEAPYLVIWETEVENFNFLSVKAQKIVDEFAFAAGRYEFWIEQFYS